MTSIEAVAFLRRQFPDVTDWTCWVPSRRHEMVLSSFTGKGVQIAGKIGDWTWARVESKYLAPSYWSGRLGREEWGFLWAGVLEIRGTAGEKFLLFSFLDSTGKIGSKYLASTGDLALLHRFAEDVYAALAPKPTDKIWIDVYGGKPVLIDATGNERLVLPATLQAEIEQQVFSFFENPELYKRLRVRHRRGFLFVGPPGNGKTMMVRHLIRICHQRFKSATSMLSIHRTTTERDLERLFEHAAQSTPGLVILEDMDSLTNESGTTRAAMLSQLDGLSTQEGLLIIGTTNNPGIIDPALVHRPSRFDRVWDFPLPNFDLRLNYLASAFESLASDALATLAKRTEGWSFAYLNELRTTAAILSLNRQASNVTSAIAGEACDLLGAQFNAGKKNHAPTAATLAGFGTT